MKKLLALASVSLLLVLTGFAFKRPEGHRAAAPEESRMEGLRVVNKENGVTTWMLESAEAALSEDGKTANLKDVVVNLPEKNMDVRSNSGIYEIEKEGLSLSGDVTAKTPEYTVTTDFVRLKEGRELVTDERVVIEGKGIKIEGKELRAKGNAFQLKHVTALVY